MNELLPLFEVFAPEQQKVLTDLAAELADNWGKSQVFRTETEALVSVLNDGKHPTEASKYWQAVREQSVMFSELVALSFEIARNDVARLRLEARKPDDQFEAKDLEIDLAENRWKAANMNRVAADRLREIRMWSAIKAELVSLCKFDTRDPNTHQAESFPIVFKNRVNTLGPNAGAADAFNAVSLYETVNRLREEGVLKTEDVRPRIE